jgi:hypothetical protein
MHLSRVQKSGKFGMVDLIHQIVLGLGRLDQACCHTFLAHQNVHLRKRVVLGIHHTLLKGF